MPELPEVEVTRRGIDRPLRDATVLGVRLGKPLRWPLGVKPEALLGTMIGPVARRGKYLWLPLHRGNPAGGLLLHLGMSGSLSLATPVPPAGAHDHFDLETSRGTLRLTDPRRFGAVVWSESLDADPAARLLGALGPEPFDPALTPESFHAALQRRRAPIKAVLLSGAAVVGAGNIYACEALHAAGIHPGARSDRISRPRAAKLLEAVRATLARALELGGSTLRDFHDAQGVAGGFQLEARVYGRAGQPCPRCGVLLQRRVQGQRASYFCPGCQRR
ncbi:MAG: bifunctional DNA-formamidopyrimidine glycosylase/DNA-(apurinic or apyrimidinic site) lyase [Burkholderiales bacterium]|nr:bifunctional DNA-formamidopyrimidine glycosylase/DNA-(apurinic or apyrimidinic site) lyase [Burkholderiales bacterium]MDE2456967.1 bifunctional DNA-formamidopyrimidine glycosylase/DNA-(apurinic or apyrimidinic site) lyase [Burkholderiales bacterium]